MADQTKTLADELQSEMARVRDEVMPAYMDIGLSGLFALTMMRADLDAATKALAEHDGVECLRLLQVLRETV